MRGGARRDRRPERSGWDTQRFPHRPDGMTYDEIAEQMGVSKEAVMQIEYRAILKLRRWCVREQP